MKNKVLVKLFVPELDCSFDVFIPINEIVWKVKKMLAKSVSDLTGGSLEIDKEYTLINKKTSTPYENNVVVANTDIRNVTELILISAKTNNVDLNLFKPNLVTTQP